MTRLAVSEKEQKKQLRVSREYFRGDYIGAHLIRNFFCATAAFLIGLLLWFLLALDTVVEHLSVLDVEGPARQILICYGVTVGIYLLLTWIVCSVRWHRAGKVRDGYRRTLQSLEREYARKGRRIDRTPEPKGDDTGE